MIEHKENWNVKIQEWAETRVDKWLSDNKDIPRTRLKDKATRIFVNGEQVKPSRRIKGELEISVEWYEPDFAHLIPQSIPLDIIYEDDNVIVINKEQGRVVHPGNGCPDNTLVNGLLYYYSALKEWEGEPLRPGIVHRLDKDTSGVIITAKNRDTHIFLSNQFTQRETKKNYLAIIEGQPAEPEGFIENNLGRDPANRIKFKVVSSGGKKAVTSYKVLKKWKDFSLVNVRIYTGRTHQIRVHMASIGCPVWGDLLYQKRKTEESLMLHAWKLRITLPEENTPRLFKAPVPLRFRQFLSDLN